MLQLYRNPDLCYTLGGIHYENRSYLCKRQGRTAHRERGCKQRFRRYRSCQVFDLTSADLAGFDAVVDAFGAWTPETLSQHSTSLAHLCDILSGTDTRLLVVGGAGSLYVNAEHTACVSDGADFPEVFKPLASAMAKALGELRQRNDVKWTYISPAGDFQADGERSGKYILAGEELTLNAKGESIISYADYAIAMVDEIEKGDHIGQRISVVRE